jgi:hypothetical protein
MLLLLSGIHGPFCSDHFNSFKSFSSTMDLDSDYYSSILLLALKTHALIYFTVSYLDNMAHFFSQKEKIKSVSCLLLRLYGSKYTIYLKKFEFIFKNCSRNFSCK